MKATNYKLDKSQEDPLSNGYTVTYTLSQELNALPGNYNGQVNMILTQVLYSMVSNANPNSDFLKWLDMGAQNTGSFDQTKNINFGDASNVFTSGSFVGNKTYNFNNANHTIGIYTTGFTGNVYVEGSLGLEAPSSDDSNWAPISIINTLDRIPFANISGPTYYNFTGNFNYLRFKYSPSAANSGSFDKILLRN